MTSSTTISLAASRSLDAHGFSGTVTSTIALRLGHPTPVDLKGIANLLKSLLGGGSKTKPMREVNVEYRATVGGSIAGAVARRLGQSLLIVIVSLGVLIVVLALSHSVWAQMLTIARWYG